MSPIDPDYVEVSVRLQQFYDRYPDGRITRYEPPYPLEVGNKTFIVYSAVAYRTPDDPTPCVGTAWEPFPGPTNYTRDSELMNAETSAWGRAIVAAGVPSKKIASHEEVRNRSEIPAQTSPPKPVGSRSQLTNQQKGRLKAELTKSGTKTAGQTQALLNIAGLHIEVREGWMDLLSRDDMDRIIAEARQGALPEPDKASDIPDSGEDFQQAAIGTDPDGIAF